MNNFGNEHRKQLEEQLKQAFTDKQFTPPAHIWDNIDAALDNPIAWYRRPIAYWSLGLVAALLLVVMFWLTLPFESPENTVITSSQHEINIEDQAKIIDPSTTTLDESSQNKLSNNVEQLNKESINNDLNKAKQVEANTAQFDNISKEENTSSTHLKSYQHQPKTDLVIAVETAKTNKELDQQDNSDNIEKSVTDGLTHADDEILLITPTIEPIELGNPIVVVKVDKLNYSDNSDSQSEENVLTKKAKVFAITIGASYSQGIFEPSFRTDSTYAATIDRAESSDINEVLPNLQTKGNYSQIGIDLGLQFGKHWSLNTGLSMGNSSYSFTNTNTYLIAVPDIQGGYERRTEPNQVQVTYNWVQIPIALGYQFGEIKAKNITGFAQFGTSIELLQSYQYLSSNDRFTYQLGSHRNTTTHIWGQVGINYHLTDRWNIWGGGMYRSSLSSLIDTQGMTMITQSYGWQVGTRFMLFKSW